MYLVKVVRKHLGANKMWFGRRGSGQQIQIPQRVQQEVGKMVTQAAMNELANAFSSRFK